MRVLLSGGIKTNNIIVSIEKKFESSGDDLFVVEYIEDIDKIFAMGNYFDKAIIAEQSITHDGRDTDEDTIRRKLNKFSKDCARRGRDESFIFLTGDDELAGMIHDETLEIHEKSAVVLKPGPYKTKFFALLITVDIPNIPDDMLYHPPVEFGLTGITEDMPDLSGISDEELNTEDDGYHPMKVNDFDTLFNNDDSLGGARINDAFTPDFGEEFTPDESTPDESQVEETGFDGEDAFGDFDENFGVGDSAPEVDWNEQDQVIETDIIEEGFAPSGDIPDYIEDNIEVESGMEDTDMGGSWGEDNFGFGVGSPNDGFNFENGGQDDGFNFGDDGQDNGFNFGDGNIGGTGNQDGFGFGQEESFDNQGYEFNPNGYDDEPVQNYSEPEQQNYDYPDSDMFGYGDNNDTNMGATMAGAVGAGMLADEMMHNMQNDWGNQQAPYQQEPYQQEPYQQAPYQQAPYMEPPYQQTQQNQQWSGQDIFDQSNYRNENEENTQIQVAGANEASDRELKKKLEAFAARGNSICVTGCGGCGTSTIAFNLANTLANLGYSVLLVDFDTECRTQNYISSDCYKSMDHDGANLMAAVNSGQGINTHTSVVKRGLHLLTMGIGGDADKPENLLNESKVSRFINLAKTSHNFVIYDVPFDSATGFLSEAVYLSDNLVLVTEMSTHGVIKTMLKVCNINEQDMQDTFFSKAQLVFNKYRNLNKLLGKKVRSARDITKIMDDTVFDLIGEDNGLYFSSMHIAGILEDDPNYELAWFEKVQYSDTPKGKKIYKELIEKIVTHK